MSTTIHHGYRVTANPLVLVEQLREALVPLRRAAYVQALTALACLIHDEPAAHPVAEPEWRSPIAAAAAQLRTRQDAADIRGLRQPDADFNCELTFLNDPTSPDDVYALLVTERDDYTAAWESLNGVRPWPYWNNTDRPDDATADEWAHRRDVWNRVLPHGPRRGLTWQLLTRTDRLPVTDLRDDVAAALPDRRARARAVARLVVPGMQLVAGRLVLRDVDAVRADLDAETDRLTPLLADITVDTLYTRPTAPSAPSGTV